MHAGLNKGEARNALARAVFIHRLGEIRDRTFEQQRYRASGLNLVTAAIVLWNTVYLERATQALRKSGKLTDDGMLQFLSPLGLGTHQPDRGLRLEAEQEGRSGATICRSGLVDGRNWLERINQRFPRVTKRAAQLKKFCSVTHRRVLRDSHAERPL